ncbi:hypothetical protein OO013_17295 [Mangrovivirga sp. M17]|uniref:Lipoprotein n=1 Tax=Mangrovivirga halotolerans TaxID=2993936 RepID=A0ABT3RVT5_9BACT|nr:hypothetical protein [Mangrovivirga halotolerans]MCX2745641.1 hypothetical protein [Mangrovivirga halotolerans]
MNKIFFQLVCIIFFVSCSQRSDNKNKIEESADTITIASKSDDDPKSQNNKQTELPEVNEEFNSFLENFKKSELPIEIKGCSGGYTGDLMFDGNRFEQFIDLDAYSYIQIPSSGNFITVISLGIADCLYPIVNTYKLNGDKIDQKIVSIGYCGSDCGYTCEEYLTIKNNYSIYVADTISSSECDSLGSIIPETTKNYIIYKEGKILDNGKIKLSEEIKKEL